MGGVAPLRDARTPKARTDAPLPYEKRRVAFGGRRGANRAAENPPTLETFQGAPGLTTQSPQGRRDSFTQRDSLLDLTRIVLTAPKIGQG
jgi:hypothetical protein